MIATLTVDGVEVTLNGDADGVASVLDELLDTDADDEPDADGRLPEWYLRVLSNAYTARRDARESDDRVSFTPAPHEPIGATLSAERLDELAAKARENIDGPLFPGVTIKEHPDDADPFDD